MPSAWRGTGNSKEESDAWRPARWITKVVCPLPETGYLRLHQIVGRPARNERPAIPALIPVSRSTWWAGVKSGHYPQPVRTLVRNITVWRVEEIMELIRTTDDHMTKRGDLNTIQGPT